MNWLVKIEDNTVITDLCIPGTHDAMTASCLDGYYRTQTLTLVEQLDAGVRYLDLRLTSQMRAAHREWISDIRSEEIFAVLAGFLAEHRSEFLILRIQNANEEKDDFEVYVSALHAAIQPWLPLFSCPDGNIGWPSVGQLRGQVLALECSPDGYGARVVGGRSWAHAWHENSKLIIQDLWDGPTVQAKRQAIARTLSMPRDGRLVLNHISSTAGDLGSPLGYAERLNPALKELLKREDRPRGVQILDYITPELTAAVIGCN